MKYKIAITDGRFSSVTHNLYFNDKKRAKKAKDLIVKTSIAHKRDRPNDPEKRFITIPHDLGEITMKVDEIDNVHLFHQQEAIDGDSDNRDDDIIRQAPLFAAGIKTAIEKLIKGDQK